GRETAAGRKTGTGGGAGTGGGTGGGAGTGTGIGRRPTRVQSASSRGSCRTRAARPFTRTSRSTPSPRFTATCGGGGRGALKMVAGPGTTPRPHLRAGNGLPSVTPASSG